MLGLKKNLVSSYDYIYMIIMVIYMGQMTEDTARMVGGLSGNPIPFIIPIITTLVFTVNHHISFRNKNLWVIICLFLVWSFAVVIKKTLFSTQELSFYFFLFYAIIVAYVHVQGFGQKLFPCFEEVMVLFCKIAFVLWTLFNIFPSVASLLMHQFPETVNGNRIWYVFNWMDPAKLQIYRNAGLSWEPGRFAVMILPAIAINLSRNGIKFKSNSNIIWLLLALVSTMSTTGYVTGLLLYSLYYVKTINIKTAAMYLLVFVPIIYFLSSLDFMGEKLRKRFDVQTIVDERMVSIDYVNTQSDYDEYHASLDRFESIYFEFIYNIPHDPLIGYGKNTAHSYYSEKISKAFTLTGGLLKLVGQLGVPLGLYIYVLLYKSSVAISEESNEKRKWAIFLVLIMSSVSYVIQFIPIYTAFWFYGLFKDTSPKKRI